MDRYVYEGAVQTYRGILQTRGTGELIRVFISQDEQVFADLSDPRQPQVRFQEYQVHELLRNPFVSEALRGRDTVNANTFANLQANTLRERARVEVLHSIPIVLLREVAQIYAAERNLQALCAMGRDTGTLCLLASAPRVDQFLNEPPMDRPKRVLLHAMHKATTEKMTLKSRF